LNIGILASHGEVIVRMDAHALPNDDYVERCVQVLMETGAACVGGRMAKTAHSPMGMAIAAATSSRFGIGDSAFHYATSPRAVESVYLGCWPRAVFEKVGLFNADLVRNQDDEYAFRVRQAGGTIWFDPRISVEYHGRESLQRLFAQYFEYGYWKVRVFREHPKAVRWRHVVPGLFVAALTTETLLSPISRNARRGLAITAATYFSVASFVSVRMHATDTAGSLGRVTRCGQMIAAFTAMHVAYGVGLWVGLRDFVLRRAKGEGV
jgi:GT2 family glycosyltransferase